MTFRRTAARAASSVSLSAAIRRGVKRAEDHRHVDVGRRTKAVFGAAAEEHDRSQIGFERSLRAGHKRGKCGGDGAGRSVAPSTTGAGMTSRRDFSVPAFCWLGLGADRGVRR